MKRTCKRLNSIIEDNSVLWRFFDFDSELNVKPCGIERILQHSSCFRRLLLPHRHFEVPVPNHFIESSLERCKYLYWLDLSDSLISSLRFLQKTPALEVLDLTVCKFLKDSEFTEIHNSANLDLIYKYNTGNICEIASKQNLITLDGYGIKLNVSQCEKILKGNCRNLQFFSVSLASSVDFISFNLKLYPLLVIVSLTSSQNECGRSFDVA